MMLDHGSRHKLQVIYANLNRTAERRYSIVVLREGMDPLHMESAPGFDPLMPHDLQHFIVEQELGIKLGIFGQLAAGGTAGTLTTNTLSMIARHQEAGGVSRNAEGLLLQRVTPTR